MRSSSCRMTGGGVPGPATLLPPSQVTSHCHWPASGGVLHTGLRRVSGSGRKQPGPWSLRVYTLQLSLLSLSWLLTEYRLLQGSAVRARGPAYPLHCGSVAPPGQLVVWLSYREHLTSRTHIFFGIICIFALYFGVSPVSEINTKCNNQWQKVWTWNNFPVYIFRLISSCWILDADALNIFTFLSIRRRSLF